MVTLASPDDAATHTSGRPAAALVEIVVPVYNEERDLEPSVRRLRQFLDRDFPFIADITIADNASTDRTWAIAQALERDIPGVRALRLERKGRGRALRAAWLASDAPVVAYMDVDLSTDLRALLPLVAPLLSGHSDVAIGSRLAAGARVVRGPRRELISRIYNLILRSALRVRFRDAQCGFKAIRGDVARRLLPLVEDDAWFFDTELLVLAERAGLRIHEVPVDWVDDPDSRVDVVRTALDDVKGIWRLLRPGLRHAASFGAIGIVSTVAYGALYLVLRLVSPPVAANAAALLLTAVGNTAANRRLTFGVQGRASLIRDHLGGLAALAVALAITTSSIGVLQALAPAAPRVVELAVLLVANALATVARFVLLRAWIAVDPGRETALRASRLNLERIPR